MIYFTAIFFAVLPCRTKIKNASQVCCHRRAWEACYHINVKLFKVKLSIFSSANLRNFSLIFHTFASRMEEEKQSKTKYYLYIDECGDQNLENFNPSFLVFTLWGVLVSRANKRKLEEEFNALIMEFWGNQDVIIHSREIRRCKNEFINLLDPDIKNRIANSRPNRISHSEESA